jgi:hypothetical protein
MLWFQGTIFAQEINKKFGMISRVELEMTNYEKDLHADAIVLYDIGKSSFERTDNSFNVIFERTKRVKIYTESGVDWAEIEIPFYMEGSIYEDVINVKACTYNIVDGKIQRTELDVSNFFDEKINKYWTYRKFAMPNVKKGSVVEYTYKIKSPYKFNLRDWEFQNRIPVLYSEYLVTLNPFYEYTFILQGANDFDVQESYKSPDITKQFGSFKYNELVHRFVMKEVPAFYSEKYISSINNYIIKLDFQLATINNVSQGTSINILTTWSEMIKDLLSDDNFGKYIKKSKRVAPKLLNIDSLMTVTTDERFDFIINFMKNNFRWDNYNSKYAYKSPNEFVKNKYGNCAEINLFTVAMLNAVEIEAYPLLISTRKHGIVRLDYPYLDFFNYVLINVNIDGKNVVTDATDYLVPNNNIPKQCINDKGLIIKKDTEKWIDLRYKQSSEEQTKISIELSDSNKLKGTIDITASSYDAYDLRRKYGNNKESLINSLATKKYNINDSSITFKNLLLTNEPYVIKYSIMNELVQLNNKIYLEPFLREVIDENPFTEKERSYSIDMIYPNRKSYVSSVMIPEGYELDFIPQNIREKNNLFEMQYYTEKLDDKIIFHLKYDFKVGVYNAKHYRLIKLYFEKIINKGNEKVVFKKI